MTTPTGIVVLTDRRAARRPLAETVEAAVNGGARWVILRETDLGYADRRALADALRQLLPPGRLIVAGIDPLGGDAVHLPAASGPVGAGPVGAGPVGAGPVGARPVGARPVGAGPVAAGPVGAGPVGAGPVGAGPVAAGRVGAGRVGAGRVGAGRAGGAAVLVGRSCHDAAELRRLSVEDYVTLSPIYPTATKPGYGPALQPAGAAALEPPVPWLALGGIDSADRAAACAAVGAAGVAVLGAVMRADDPAAAVRALVQGFGG